jgi:hypothetical protein
VTIDGVECIDLTTPGIIVGCMDAGTPCGEAETYAQSPYGDCMWFSDTCVPEGWSSCTVDGDICTTPDDEPTDADDGPVSIDPDSGDGDGGVEPVPLLRRIDRSPCPLDTSGDPVELVSLGFETDILILDVSHSGGCGEHDYQLCWGGELAPGVMPEIHIKFSHFNRDDACEGIVSEKLRFDLSSVYTVTGRGPFNVKVKTPESSLTETYSGPGVAD